MTKLQLWKLLFWIPIVVCGLVGVLFKANKITWKTTLGCTIPAFILSESMIALVIYFS